jgi:hypothetical protein
MINVTQNKYMAKVEGIQLLKSFQSPACLTQYFKQQQIFTMEMVDH